MVAPDLQVYDLSVSQAYGYLSDVMSAAAYGDWSRIRTILDDVVSDATFNRTHWETLLRQGDTNNMDDEMFMAHLRSLASQENHDGDPWNALVDAADRLYFANEALVMARRAGRKEVIKDIIRSN